MRHVFHFQKSLFRIAVCICLNGFTSQTDFGKKGFWNGPLKEHIKAQKESESWWNIGEEIQHEWFWAKMLNNYKGTWKVKQQKQKQQKNSSFIRVRNRESQPLFRSYRKTTRKSTETRVPTTQYRESLKCICTQKLFLICERDRLLEVHCTNIQSKRFIKWWNNTSSSFKINGRNELREVYSTPALFLYGTKGHYLELFW